MKTNRLLFVGGFVAAVLFVGYITLMGKMVYPLVLAAETQTILPTDTTIVGVGQSSEAVAPNGTLTFTFDPGSAATVDLWELLYVGIHMTTSDSADKAWTISLDSGLGSNFDQVLKPLTISSGDTDFFWEPTAKMLLFDDDDKVIITGANTSVATVGVQMLWRGGK